MKLLMILAWLCVAVRCHIYDSTILRQWTEYKKQFGKVYDDHEQEEERLVIFVGNLKEIQEHNAKYDLNQTQYKLGVNQFTDMREEEVRAQLSCFAWTDDMADRLVCSDALPDKEPLIELDWREKGAVSPVQDQANCGSCYAFAAAGSIEGQLYVKSRQPLQPLSKQNLIDCSRQWGNSGCDKGSATDSYKYVKENKGIDYEKAYPYIGEAAGCKFIKRDDNTVIKGHCATDEGDEFVLMKALAATGPMSVTIDASSPSFYKYFGGIYSNPDCGKKLEELNFQAVLVGYGSQGGQDYWLVKSSLGTSWGENGYIRMTRNAGNQCGIATLAQRPLF